MHALNPSAWEAKPGGSRMTRSTQRNPVVKNWGEEKVASTHGMHNYEGGQNTQSPGGRAEISLALIPSSQKFRSLVKNRLYVACCFQAWKKTGHWQRYSYPSLLFQNAPGSSSPEGTQTTLPLERDKHSTSSFSPTACLSGTL